MARAGRAHALRFPCALRAAPSPRGWLLEQRGLPGSPVPSKGPGARTHGTLRLRSPLPSASLRPPKVKCALPCGCLPFLSPAFRFSVSPLFHFQFLCKFLFLSPSLVCSLNLSRLHPSRRFLSVSCFLQFPKFLPLGLEERGRG